MSRCAPLAFVVPIQLRRLTVKLLSIPLGFFNSGKASISLFAVNIGINRIIYDEMDCPSHIHPAKEEPPRSQAVFLKFMEFFSMVDLLLGLCIGALILMRLEMWEAGVSIACSALQRKLRDTVGLLMSEPIGMKLNDELAGFLGSTILQGLDIWVDLVHRHQPVFARAIMLSLGASSLTLGAGSTACLLGDFLLLAGLPLVPLIWLMRVLFNTQLQLLIAYGRFSMAQKWNPLHQRVDSVQATLGQLALSSLLFTAAFLLLPTTAVFYCFSLAAYLTLVVFRHGLFAVSCSAERISSYRGEVAQAASSLEPSTLRLEISLENRHAVQDSQRETVAPIKGRIVSCPDTKVPRGFWPWLIGMSSWGSAHQWWNLFSCMLTGFRVPSLSISAPA